MTEYNYYIHFTRIGFSLCPTGYMENALFSMSNTPHAVYFHAKKMKELVTKLDEEAARIKEDGAGAKCFLLTVQKCPGVRAFNGYAKAAAIGGSLRRYVNVEAAQMWAVMAYETSKREREAAGLSFPEYWTGIETAMEAGRYPTPSPEDWEAFNTKMRAE